MPYTEFDSANPQASQSPAAYATSDLSDLRTLRDMAVLGRVNGFVTSRVQGSGPDASRPQYMNWINTTLVLGFRMVSTWGGTGNFQQATVTWQYNSVDPANNVSVNWTNMGTTQSNTWDANDNITASTSSGGLSSWIMEIWTKTLRVVAGLASHAATSILTAHPGAGTMAAQNAAAVAVTGGTIDGVNIGNTTRGLGSFTRVVENVNPLNPTAGAGVTVDWSFGGSFITNNGTNTITFSNIPAGMGGHLVRVSNLNATNFPGTVSWGLGGKPSIAGECWVMLLTSNSGTSVYASVAWRAV